MDFFTRIPIDGADEYLLFTPTYFLALAVSLLLMWLCWRYLPKLKSWKHEKWIRIFVAIYLLYTTYNIYSFFWQNDLEWYAYIPEGTCGFGAFVAVYVLLTKSRSGFVILFYWGWGAFLAVFAPNILEGPDKYFFYQFYIRHILLVLVSFYMIRVFDYRIGQRDYRLYVYVTLPLSLIGYLIGNLIGDPKYANLFFMIRPAISGTFMDSIHAIHPLLYTSFWVAVAFLFGYLYGLPFINHVERKKLESGE